MTRQRCRDTNDEGIHVTGQGEIRRGHETTRLDVRSDFLSRYVANVTPTTAEGLDFGMVDIKPHRPKSTNGKVKNDRQAHIPQPNHADGGLTRFNPFLEFHVRIGLASIRRKRNKIRYDARRTMRTTAKRT